MRWLIYNFHDISVCSQHNGKQRVSRKDIQRFLMLMAVWEYSKLIWVSHFINFVSNLFILVLCAPHAVLYNS